MKTQPGSMLRFTRQFVSELWPWYLSGALFLIVTNIITLEIPQFAKEIVNALEKRTEVLPSASLAQLALGIALLGFAQIIVRSASRILIFWPGRRLEASSKSYLFGRALRLRQVFFDKFGMGDLISRLSNDLGQLRVFYAFAVLQVLNLCFIAIFTLYKMFSVHAALTASALVPILFMLVTARFIMPQLQRFTKANQEALGALTNRVTESFTNIHIIQSNAAESSFQKLIEAENEKVYLTDTRVLVLRTLFFPLMTCLTGLAQLIVLFYGGQLVMRQELSVGDILAFNVYLSYLAFPLTSIGIVLAIYQRSKSALERLDPLFEEPVEKEEAPAPPPAAALREAPLLRFQNLSYRYPSQGPTEKALEGLSFELKAGEMLGLCGPIGSGKSTILHLLTRIYDPPSGSIFLGGVDILQLEPAVLRQRLAYAQQRVHLFSASIRENLGLGLTPKPDQATLERAAAAAQLLREIEAFPLGWETEIGEKGLRLSGGQKQRLALARVFLRSPELLLLDDVLSAVDNLTEARLLQELRQRRVSMLISSHRSSVLKLCDRVLYLEDGVLRDEGSFNELIQRHPHLCEDIHDDSE